jgi:hypothetical protein
VSADDELVDFGIDELDLLLQPTLGEEDAPTNEWARFMATAAPLLGEHVGKLTLTCHQGSDFS